MDFTYKFDIESKTRPTPFSPTVQLWRRQNRKSEHMDLICDIESKIRPTPFHLLCSCDDNNIENQSTCLDFTSKCDIESKTRPTPFQLLCSCGDDSNIENQSTCLGFTSKCDIESKTRPTPFHLLCSCGDDSNIENQSTCLGFTSKCDIESKTRPTLWHVCPPHLLSWRLLHRRAALWRMTSSGPAVSERQPLQERQLCLMCWWWRQSSRMALSWGQAGSASSLSEARERDNQTQYVMPRKRNYYYHTGNCKKKYSTSYKTKLLFEIGVYYFKTWIKLERSIQQPCFSHFYFLTFAFFLP